MRNLTRHSFSLRRKPTTTDPRVTSYQRQHEIDLQRQNSMQSELHRYEQESFARREEEDRQKQERLQRAEDERYRQQQLAFQLQEAEGRRQDQLRQTTPRALMHMQDLIRRRHELDLEIWRARDVSQQNQDILIQKGRQADEILKEIRDIVELWNEIGWEPKEWEIARVIKQNIEGGNQRCWATHPAWVD